MGNFKRYIVLWGKSKYFAVGKFHDCFCSHLMDIRTNKFGPFLFRFMSFCNYVPYILISILVGAFIDSHRKKAVMLVADSIAALASLLILAFFNDRNSCGRTHLYL